LENDMSNPDWTEAPDQATHYDCNADVFCTVDGWWHKSQYVPVENKEWGTDRYTPRPVEPATTPWGGTGLPPVGVECRHHSGRIYVVTGIANENTQRPDQYPVTIIYKNVENGTVWSRPASEWARSFRPIRTQAQIDRTQLVKTLNQLRGETDVGVIADAIIEMGFRITKP
jgi:hypothetical protein